MNYLQIWKNISTFAKIRHIHTYVNKNMSNKYYAIAYKLSTIKDGEKTLAEEAPANDPFVFISGFGTTIPGFEKHIEPLQKGDTFDFVIPCSEAYGEHIAERIIQLDKPEGDEFDISVGAIIPLQNEEGQRFMGHITAVEGNKVTIDLNHPLAGFDLNFAGTVTECREATNEEIQQLINSLSGGCHGGCGGCGGGSCGGNCGGGDGDCNCGDGDCNCGDGGCNCGK